MLDWQKTSWFPPLGLLARARAAHRPIAAAGLSDHYREIFTITRLSDFMEIQ